MKITISKLERPIYTGDWHDRPLNWGVFGPNNEVQHFCTKKNAELYKKYRKMTNSMPEAAKLYINT